MNGATGLDLAALMPALLDALAVTKTGVLVLADRGRGLERLYVNEHAAGLLGYTPAEFLAGPPLERIVPAQRSLANALSSNFRSGLPIPPTLEFSALHKDGSAVPVELAMGHARDAEATYYVMIMRPVGRQNELTLLEDDRIGLVGALAAGIAHEINNPLTSVLLNLRSLRKQIAAHVADAAQAQALRCVDDITTGAERIGSNVRALQTLATRSETKRIDLAAVVSASLRLAAPTLEPRAHVVRQILPVRAVHGEESRVGQAVLAMMLFSSSGFDSAGATATNRIVVVVEERDGAVVVEVSDNGRELPAEEAHRAFDPFFRSSSRGAGMGVGLGVARSVATTLGGEVTLAPREGGGAVITMRLPTADGGSTGDP